MNILITSAGRRVSLVRFFQKELKTFFENALVLAADANPKLSAACQVADAFYQVPLFTSDDYIDAIEKICISNNISLVIPTHDSELMKFALSKERFKKNNIQLLVSESDFVIKCRNKRIIHEFFQEYDVPVAFEYDRQNYKLPIFIKPIDGSRSEGTRLIRKKYELKEEYINDNKLMFLEYLDHKVYDEYTCDMYYDKNHNLKCVVPRRRIEVRDGEVNKGVTIKNDLVTFIRSRLGNIQGAIGCLTTQFFMHRESKRIVGIEINPRFGGGFPLTYMAGANYPKWIIQEYLLDTAIEDGFSEWEENLLMLRYDDEIIIHGYQGN